MGNETQGRTTVDVHISTASTAVWKKQQEVIDEIEEYERNGTIDHYRVQSWSKKISLSGPLSTTRFHRAAAKTAEEFESWADRQGHSIDLPFERETISSELTGGTYHVLRPPSLCVALYESDELAGVFPCEVGSVQYTVDDLLSKLKKHESVDEELARSLVTVP